jgi:type IV secretion system protein VirD4
MPEVSFAHRDLIFRRIGQIIFAAIFAAAIYWLATVELTTAGVRWAAAALVAVAVLGCMILNWVVQNLFVRRIQQVLLVAITGVLVYFMVTSSNLDNWRYPVCAVVLLLCLLLLTVEEHRYMKRTWGFDWIPTGHGSMRNLKLGGSKRFLSLWEYLTRFKWKPGSSGIFLGRPLAEQRPFGLFSRAWVGIKDDRHMLTVAANRSGKGTAALIPNLLFYPGSALVIDPKGELARITAARRGTGVSRIKNCLQQEVHIIDLLVDPTDPTLSGVPNHLPAGFIPAQWNPLNEIPPDDSDLVAKVQSIAFALLPPEPNANDQFFINQCRDLLSALIQHVITAEEEENRNLIYVRKLLQQGDVELFEMLTEECEITGEPLPSSDPFDALIHYMESNTALGGKIQGFARRFRAMPEQTRNTVVSDLYGRTSFLDLAKLEKMLLKSSFKLVDLKRKPMTIYFCASGTRLGAELKPIAYIFIDMAIRAMEATPSKPRAQVLFAMDEFNALGRHGLVEKAMGLVAGAPYHIKLWPVIQAMSQLKDLYPSTWSTFLRNCGAVQYAGDQDRDVIEDLERDVGEIVTKRPDGTFDKQPLLSRSDLASEYFTFQSRRQLVMMAGFPAAPLELCDYYRFRWMKRLTSDPG